MNWPPRCGGSRMEGAQVLPPSCSDLVVEPDCKLPYSAGIGNNLIRPHHLVVFVVDDVAMPHIVE